VDWFIGVLMVFLNHLDPSETPAPLVLPPVDPTGPNVTKPPYFTTWTGPESLGTQCPTDPVEIVAPLLKADSSWPTIIDPLWRTILQNFEVRLDTTSGTHIHISWEHGSHDDTDPRRPRSAQPADRLVYVDRGP
jgi:hypothetical protein